MCKYIKVICEKLSLVYIVSCSVSFNMDRMFIQCLLPARVPLGGETGAVAPGPGLWADGGPATYLAPGTGPRAVDRGGSSSLPRTGPGLWTEGGPAPYLAPDPGLWTEGGPAT